MKTEQIASQLAALLRQGQFESAQRELFHPSVVSIEPEKANIPPVEGIEAILAKGAQFRESVAAWHGIAVSQPVVASGYFSIALKVDLTFKGQEPSTMDEIIVYETDGEKITKEVFYY
ncbi:MAG: SnoaL-like domain-containing protein [Bacteroidota bacterium]